MVVIADESKWVATLGAFRCRSKCCRSALRRRNVPSKRPASKPAAGARRSLRQSKDGHAFVTDGGHWILDAALGHIAQPKLLADKLAAVPGVMEHGLFIGLANLAIIASAGGVRLVERAQT